MMAIARANRCSCRGLVGRICAVGGCRVLGRVVVWRLRGRVGRVLVVHGVVLCRNRRFPLLVGVSRGSVCGGALRHCRGRSAWRLLVVIVNDDDLFGQAVPVELVPVRPPALGLAGAAVGHFGDDWGQLLRLAVALRGSA